LTAGADARFIHWSSREEMLWIAATWGSDSLEVRRLDVTDGSVEPFSPPVILGSASGVAYFDLADDDRRLVYLEREVIGDIWTLNADEGRF
jgi:hypothetical protein